MTFETDKSVLFIEMSLIQRCPYRERFHCLTHLFMDSVGGGGEIVLCVMYV